MRNFKNILTMVVGSLSILFYTQIGSAINVTGEVIATEKAGTQLDTDQNHSSLTRVFLLCDEGTTAGAQKCAFYVQALVGIEGAISGSNDSKVVMAAGGSDISATIYGASTTLSTSYAEEETVTGALVAPLGGVDPSTALSTTTNAISVATAQGDASTTLATLGGDLCRTFNANDSFDLHYDGTDYSTAGPTTIGTWLGGASTRTGLFLMQGFAIAGGLDRTEDLGYATSFTVPYTMTVESNIAKASGAEGAASCGD